MRRITTTARKSYKDLYLTELRRVERLRKDLDVQAMKVKMLKEIVDEMTK